MLINVTTINKNISWYHSMKQIQPETLKARGATSFEKFFDTFRLLFFSSISKKNQSNNLQQVVIVCMPSNMCVCVYVSFGKKNFSKNGRK